MSKLVTIYGGSGFVGRYIAQRMAKAGWRVRVAVRRPNEALHVKPYGAVGQLEPVLCNIRDDDSVAQAMRGADAVVNCVGILAPKGKNTFEAVQAEGAARIARLAAAQGISKMVHISAIGADAEAQSAYSRTKAEGEAGVFAHMPQATILRPSVIFGAEDDFFNRFASMSRMGPILPIVGGDTTFQPVYVDDVAQAVEQVLTTDAPSGIYELGGPDIASLRRLMDEMLTTIRRKRLVLNIPFFLARIMAFFIELANKLSLGIFPLLLTGDQVQSLKSDNIVSGTTRTFRDLGITPVSTKAILASYLWRFRPSGQYEALKESAQDLNA